MGGNSKIGGYLLIDHSASPGLGRYTGNLNEVSENSVPEGYKFEADTYRCSHCHAIVIFNAGRIRPREYCRSCDSNICDNCALEAKNPDYIHRSLNQIFDTMDDIIYQAQARGSEKPNLILPGHSRFNSKT